MLGSCTISRCDETGAVSVMLGNGDGTFQNPVTYNISGEAESVAAADLNGDGIPDLAVAATSQISFATEVDVFLGNGDGTFQAPVGYSAGVSYGPTSLAIADVNGDGNLDVIGNGIETDLSGQVSVLLGYGNGTFGSPKVDHTIYSTGGHNGSCVWVAVGDLNGDKRPDLAVVNTVDYTVVAMLNTTLTSTATTIASSLNPV